MTPCQIAVVTSLCKSGHSNEYICNETGISARTVRRWVRKFKLSTDGDVQLPGRPRKLDQRALRIMRRQVEAEPSITARQLKQRNPGILGQVSVRTIQRHLHNDLGYVRRRARKKALVTARQAK